MQRRSTLTRKQLLVLLGIATVAFDLALILIDRRLQATGGPGIVSFEFVRSEQRAAQFMGEWGAHGRYLARLSLWIDFGFMAAYGSFFALAAVATRDFARGRGLRRLALAGAVAPFCAIGAACFDALENINLLLILGGRGGHVSPVLATTCASIKFVLIGLAIAYVLWGLAARALRSGE